MARLLVIQARIEHFTIFEMSFFAVTFKILSILIAKITKSKNAEPSSGCFSGNVEPIRTDKTCCHTERLTLERDEQKLYHILRTPLNDEHDDDHHLHDDEVRVTKVKLTTLGALFQNRETTPYFQNFQVFVLFSAPSF